MMFTAFFDRLAVTLLERQVRDPRHVDLVETWDRYVPSAPGERGEHLLGAYWDPVWFAPSGPGRVRSVDTVNVCQYADLMCHVYRSPSSCHHGDERARQSAEAAIDFCARRIVSGRPIINRCFDFGLLALAESVETLAEHLPADVGERARDAMRLAVGDLLDLYDASDEPPGVHNHQAITGHTVLLCGMVLDDDSLTRRGRQILHANLGYFDDEGAGSEHDRKYDMTVAGTLVRAWDLTGEPAWLQTARRAARHAAPFVTLAGELVELTSHRPDCCGDDMVAYALYTFHHLGHASRDGSEDDHFAAIARRMTHCLQMRQRPDGLLPGFLYAQEDDYRCAKMDPYYMTGYGLPALMWADRVPARAATGHLPDICIRTEAERVFIHRCGTMQVMASGYGRQALPPPPQGLRDGPADVLVIDHCGPGVWGLACRVRVGDRWYGDIGGFTPRLRLAADAWRCRPQAEGWLVCQRLEILDDDGRPVTSLDCELQVGAGRALLALRGSLADAREWVIGPNVRAALGGLVFQHGRESDDCRRLTGDHAFTGPIDLLANGRRLRVSVESERDAQTFLTPLIGKNQSLEERLVPGQVWGLRASVGGAHVDLRWQFSAM